ncbi:GGDEF domain-containing protein [Paenibacillus sp. FSL R10-2782]|uniref:GGDEF domain-containing protein n=1 Tax=Paenibacillus sp. FSL R10-2782 TaxID=2954661 RepID=UPI003158BD69
MRINLQLEAMASTDPLTGLKNRRYFQDKLLAGLASFQETGLSFSLLIIDIERFKSINDTYGHSVGDLVLTNLAELLQSMSRDIDIVARYGGEKFVIILPDNNQEEAILTAERYRSTTASMDWGEYTITVSIGVATVTQEDTEQSIVHKADLALYASKSGGRNWVTHSASLAKS